ncbi:aminotransferase class V-fold PLP-dependent enzyme [Sphingomonas sp. NIBR02145]|uniref:cysteine desulfurase family protein n=1 Tax=Sphingomonas sp. NIBR02145 TaxID=3014784 RepID=UPI0022B50962|nr:aminotransferase class V-fold PLP-dependent enzyme [Sphingomonas sp. NIBR02145]WHU02406.1 aminotransferase class V-fold PLP-dependent enzyme [Sphingomonas sp. NIBR02145]
MTTPIYLDFQATTPVDPRVLAEMLPWFAERWGNPHATDHRFGRDAAQAIQIARQQVATLIGADPREIIFSSGATESNNFLLQGASAVMAAAGRSRVITCATEHKAVLEVVAQLAIKGHPVTMLDVPASGIIDPVDIARHMGSDVGLVSIMAINNEIGVEQPITAIGALCREHGALFHTDAAQAVGKIPIDVVEANIDLLSLSAHKFYGPQGIGAAYIRRAIKPNFPPRAVGGGQEGGLRSGTLPTALCVGLGSAAQIAQEEMVREREQLTRFRDRFLALLDDARMAYVINGELARRWPGNLNLSFDAVDAEALLMSVGEVLALSSGSACTAQSLEPSHVITAIVDDPDRAENAVRIGFGRSTSAEEIDRAAAILISAVQRLRQLSHSAAEGV